MLIGKRGDVGYKTKVHLSNQLKEGVCFGKNSKLIVGRLVPLSEGRREN